MPRDAQLGIQWVRKAAQQGYARYTNPNPNPNPDFNPNPNPDPSPNPNPNQVRAGRAHDGAYIFLYLPCISLIPPLYLPGTRRPSTRWGSPASLTLTLTLILT